MAFKNMNFEDTDQEFDPEFAEFHAAAAKRALKPKPANLSPSKQSSVLVALERLPGCGKNGEAHTATPSDAISLRKHHDVRCRGASGLLFWISLPAVATLN